MFMGGAFTGYFYIFPFAFDFFLHVAPVSIQPLLSMNSYFSFASALLLAFGFLFELPVFVILLNLIGVVRVKTLWKTWRYMVVAIFVLSAILTPADPYTMLLLAIPLTVLYFGSLLICTIIEKAKPSS